MHGTDRLRAAGEPGVVARPRRRRQLLGAGERRPDYPTLLAWHAGAHQRPKLLRLRGAR
jgi:hypothetical protein